MDEESEEIVEYLVRNGFLVTIFNLVGFFIMAGMVRLSWLGLPALAEMWAGGDRCSAG